jgi:PAS domain S-box-containing protein
MAKRLETEPAASPVASPPHRWRRSAVLAGACFALCVAGWVIARPPGYASALWPAAGIALAGLLRWGAVVWPGVFAGNFAFGVWLDPSPVGLAIAAALAAAAALQGALGAALTRRLVEEPSAWIDERAVWCFLWRAGPFPCLMAPTLGVATLVTAGELPLDRIGAYWLTWWTGNTLGTVLFAPPLLVSGATAAGAGSRARIALPLVISAFLLAALHSGLTRLDAAHDAAELTRLKNEAYAAGVRPLNEALEPVHHLERLFLASEHVNRQEFVTFSASVLNRLGLVACAWIVPIGSTERSALEAALRREYGAAFGLAELASDGRLVPAAVRSLHFVEYLAEPLAGNRTLIGLDHASVAAHRIAIERARDQASPVATAPLRLLRTGRQGMQVYAPIYRAGFDAAGATVAARRVNLRGLVLGEIDFEQLLQPLATAAATRGLTYRVTDVTPGEPTRSVLATIAPDHASAWQLDVVFADRHWRLEMAPVPGAGNSRASIESMGYQGFSVLAALLIGFAVLTAAGRQASTDAQVARRTAELARELEARRSAELALRERERELAITLQSIGDAVLATDTEQRIVRMNHMAEQLTGWTQAEALGLPVDEVLHLVDETTRRRFPPPVAEVLLTGMTQSLINPVILIARDGRECVITDSAAPIRRDDGSVRGVVVVFRDSGAQRAAEIQMQRMNAELEQRVAECTAALAERERFNQATLDALGAHSAVLDAAGNIVATTRAWRELARTSGACWPCVSAASNYLDTCRQAADPGNADAARTLRSVRAVIDGREASGLHEYASDGAGERRWFLCHVTRFPDGGPVRVVVTHEDVTASRRARDEAVRNQERVTELSDAAPDQSARVATDSWRPRFGISATACARNR